MTVAFRIETIRAVTKRLVGFQIDPIATIQRTKGTIGMREPLLNGTRFIRHDYPRYTRTVDEEG